MDPLLQYKEMVWQERTSNGQQQRNPDAGKPQNQLSGF